MSTTKECEKLRGGAEVKLRKEIRLLEKACGTDAPNLRLVANLLTNVNTAYDSLVDCHVGMVLKMNSDLGEERHTRYINQFEDMIDELRVRAQVILGEADIAGAPVEVAVDAENLREDYNMAVLRINAQITDLQATVATRMTVVQHEALTQQAQELNQVLTVKFRELCVKLRAALPEEAETLKEQHNAEFKVKIPQVEKILTDLRARKPDDRNGPVAQQQPVPVIPGAPNAVQSAAQVRKQSIKLKPLDASVFDGKAKNYARFKQRFEEMITANFDSMGQLEFLEKGLPMKVKDQMLMVQKMPTQIWSQLEEMFADPKVMIREAVEELHSLDSKQLGDNFVSRLATTLVDTETLLDNNGNGDYLCCP